MTTVTTPAATQNETASIAREARSVRRPGAVLVFAIAILAVIAGIVVRCATVDRRVCQIDESGTMIFVSGYSVADLFKLKLSRIELDDLKKFQRYCPEQSDIAAVKGLARCMPDQAPLYYLILRPVARMVGGDSLIVARSISVAAGVLSIGALFWLCLEATGSAVFASMAAAIVGLSPLQLIFTQQARPYGLWELTLLLSSVALMRALKKNTKMSWLVYCAATTLTVYSHLVTCTLLCAQAAYTLIVERFRPTNRVVAFFISVSAATILLLPWLKFFIFGHPMFTAVFRKSLTIGYVLKHCVENAVSGFVADADFVSGPFRAVLLAGLALTVAACAVVAYKKRSETPFGLYALCVCLSPLLLVLRYLQTKECVFTINRYVLPSILFAQVLVAFGLSQLWQKQGKRSMPIATALFALIICIEAVSLSWYSGQTDIRNLGEQLDRVAETIRPLHDRLVVTDLGVALLLSHQHLPNLKMALVAPKHLEATEGIHEPFVFIKGMTFTTKSLDPSRFSVVPSPLNKQVFFVSPKESATEN